MNALSVNSVSNNYVQLSVAQQRVATDRADVKESESRLKDDEAQLDKDLTYLATLQKKTHGVQQLEGSQAQENALGRIEKTAQLAQQISQQTLAALSAAISDKPALGTNINVVA